MWIFHTQIWHLEQIFVNLAIISVWVTYIISLSFVPIYQIPLIVRFIGFHQNKKLSCNLLDKNLGFSLKNKSELVLFIGKSNLWGILSQKIEFLDLAWNTEIIYHVNFVHRPLFLERFQQNQILVSIIWYLIKKDIIPCFQNYV